MLCSACTSERQAEFGAEMSIHFLGREGLDNPAVWVFPKLVTCLDCGSVRFNVSKTDLALLASSPPSGRLTMVAAG